MEQVIVFFIGLGLIVGVMSGLGYAQDQGVVTYVPEEIDDVLHNPHMGWVYYTTVEKLLAEGVPEEFDVVGILVSWDALEPLPDRFLWLKLDRAIEYAKELNKTISVLLLLMSSDVWKMPGVPGWLWTRFEVPYQEVYDERINYTARHPLYWNETYLERVRIFVNAFAEHYNGSGIDYVDMRVYSLYGEWDCGWAPFEWPDKVTKRSTLKKLVEIYRDAFADTDMWLTVNFSSVPDANYDEYMEETALFDAMDAGFAIRYDAFGPHPVVPYVRQAIDEYGKTRFVTGETTGWDPTGRIPVGPTLRQVIEAGANHVSFAFDSIGYAAEDFINHYYRYYEYGLKNFGYRLVITKAVYPNKLQAGSTLQLETEWINKATGRLYRPYPLQVLLMQDGQPVWTDVDYQFDPTVFYHGEINRVSSQFSIPTELPAGVYELYVALVNKNGEPAIELAISGNNGHKQYYLGEITIFH